MKTIGLIGGISWQSTATYYKLINQMAAEQLGGLHSAPLLLHSVDFAEIETRQQAGKWDECGQILADAARGLENGGAQVLAICANTMHKVYDDVAGAVQVPVVHIADATADELAAAGQNRVALLGTRYTMQQDFYKERLWARGFEVLLPELWQQDEVNRIIFEELCKGIVTDTSKEFYLSLIRDLGQQGAQGVILGCTEIGMLVKQRETNLPLFDTAYIHAKATVQAAMGHRRVKKLQAAGPV